MVGMNKTSEGYTQQQLLDVFHAIDGGYADMRAWGAVYSHRQACMRLFRDTVFEMLADPAMSRSKMRLEVARVAKQIEEWGP